MRRRHVGNKNLLRLQSLVSEEDEDEDEEEGKTAVQADEKMKNNKPGLHGAVLLSLINKKLMCDGGEVSTRCQLFQMSWFPGEPTEREFLSDTALWAPEMQPGIHLYSEEFPVKVRFKKQKKHCPASLRDPHTLVELSAFSAINRFQPFNVAVSSNVLLLMVSNDQQRLDAHSLAQLLSEPFPGLSLSPDQQRGGGLPRRQVGHQHAT